MRQDFAAARQEAARSAVSRVRDDIAAALAREPRDIERRYGALDALWRGYDTPHRAAMRETMMLLIAEART